MTHLVSKMRLHGPAGAYLAEIRTETLRILRAPELFIPVVLLPLAFYLLMGVSMRGLRAKGGLSDMQVFMSFGVYGAFAVGLVNVGVTLASDRAMGLLQLKRALPVPPAAVLLGKIAVALALDLVIFALLAALALNLGGVHLGAGRLALSAGVFLLGAAPAVAMGLFIAAHLSLSAASAAANAVFVGMMMLGGVFYPLPGALKTMKPVWPSYHLHQLGLAAGGAPYEGSIAWHWAVLLGVTLVFAALTARAFARRG